MQLPTSLPTCNGSLKIVEDRALSQYVRKDGVDEVPLPPLRLMRHAGTGPYQQRSSHLTTTSMPQHDRWSNELKTGGKPKMPSRNYDINMTENTHKTIRTHRSQHPTESIIGEVLRIVEGCCTDASPYECSFIETRKAMP